MSVSLRDRYGEPQLIDVGRNDNGRRKGGPINTAPRSVSGPLVAGGGGLAPSPVYAATARIRVMAMSLRSSSSS